MVDKCGSAFLNRFSKLQQMALFNHPGPRCSSMRRTDLKKPLEVGCRNRPGPHLTMNNRRFHHLQFLVDDRCQRVRKLDPVAVIQVRAVGAFKATQWFKIFEVNPACIDLARSRPT